MLLLAAFKDWGDLYTLARWYESLRAGHILNRAVHDLLLPL